MSKKRSCSFSKPALLHSTNISQDVNIQHLTVASLRHLLKTFLPTEKQYLFFTPRPARANSRYLTQAIMKLLYSRHKVQFLLRSHRISLVKCDLGHSSRILVLIHCWYFWSSFRWTSEINESSRSFYRFYFPLFSNLNISGLRINISFEYWQQASHSVKYIGKLMDFHLVRSKQK